jgi:hypothetical protein
MRTKSSLVEKIARFFGIGGDRQSELTGSRYNQNWATSYQQKLNLDIPEIPIRPVFHDLNNSYELVEIETWCYEAKHAIFRMASDCFQQIDGVVGSWYVPDTLIDGSPVNIDILAIAKDLSSRMKGKHHVLGAARLRRAIVECLHGGDSFIELEISKEGLGRNDYGISDSLYLPKYSVFVDEDEHGGIQNYIQRSRLQPSPDDLLINPLKILHFCYDQKGSYGMPITFQSLEPWRKLKACSMDLEQAARDCGIAPWLHTMPEGKDDKYRNAYKQDFESELSSGIVTNLFLLSGADVKKAASNSDSLESLMNYWLSLRYQCLPPGIPHWFFPGMGLESSSGKDIANQPAMNYGRTISDLRSLAGEQIKWALSIEIVLQKGFDWYVENRAFDIAWPKWFVTGQEADIMAEEEEQNGGKVSTDEGNTNGTNANSQKATAVRNKAAGRYRRY